MTDPITITDYVSNGPHECHNDTGGTRCDICFGPLGAEAEPVTILPPARAVISPEQLVKIAREVAMDIQELSHILKQFSLTPEQYTQHVEPNAFFQRALEAYRIEWNSALSTRDRIRVQAATALEESLPSLAARITKDSESLDAQVKGAALFAKLAGVDDNKDGGESSEKFSISINLGADIKLKYEKDVTPRKDTSISEDLRSLTEGSSHEITLRPVGKED